MKIFNSAGSTASLPKAVAKLLPKMFNVNTKLSILYYMMILPVKMTGKFYSGAPLFEAPLVT